jgi:hypothetical protein
MNSHARLAEVRRTFVPPPRLGASRPRNVRLTTAGRALAATAFLLFAAAVVVFALLSREVQRQAAARRALVEHGRVTTGEVTRLWTSGDDRRRVNYRFVVDGRPYDGHLNVSAERRRALQVRSPLSVRYVATDPTINDLGGPLRSGMPVLLPYVLAALVASGGGLCLVAIRRQCRLLAEGRPAPALVTRHMRHHTSHGGTHRSIAYDFPLLSGGVASGKSATSRTPPAIGSVICVIYDPESPRRNSLYPLSLVAPAG